MAKKIEIPQDAFIVKSEYTTFSDAIMGEPAIKQYNKILSEVLDSGDDMAQAIAHAEDGIRQYFKMYMEKYYPNKEITR